MDTDDAPTPLPSILEVVQAWAQVIREAGPLVSRIDMRRSQIEALGERVHDLPEFGEAIGGPFMGVPLIVDDDLPDDVAYRVHCTDGTLKDVPLPRPHVFPLDRAALELADDGPLWNEDLAGELADAGRIGPPWFDVAAHPHMPPDHLYVGPLGGLQGLARAWTDQRLRKEFEDTGRLIRIIDV